jgi:hypothetical protein
VTVVVVVDEDELDEDVGHVSVSEATGFLVGSVTWSSGSPCGTLSVIVRPLTNVTVSVQVPADSAGVAAMPSMASVPPTMARPTRRFRLLNTLANSSRRLRVRKSVTPHGLATHGGSY